MTVIGYIKRCTSCDITMLVTTENKDLTSCPECLHDQILDALDKAAADDYPIGEVQI